MLAHYSSLNIVLGSITLFPKSLQVNLINYHAFQVIRWHGNSSIILSYWIFKFIFKLVSDEAFALGIFVYSILQNLHIYIYISSSFALTYYLVSFLTNSEAVFLLFFEFFASWKAEPICTTGTKQIPKYYI